MKIEWNKITWYSKLLAIIVFVATLCIGFYLGTIYQSRQDSLKDLSPVFLNN